MFNYVYDKIKNLSTWKGVLVFFVLFIIFLVAIDGKPFGVAKLKEHTNGVGILDLERSYSPEYAYEVFKLQGDVGRQFYKRLLISLDFIFPLTYMLFLSTILTFVLRRWLPYDNMLQKLSLIPFIAGLADYLENICILIMLNNYPKELYNIAMTGNVFTILKGALTVLSFLVLIIGLIGLLIQVIHNKNTENA